jgi:hypothetical protein
LLPIAKRSISFDRGSSDGIQRGRSGSADAGDATGSNGPASAREECDGLRADAIDAATRPPSPQGTTATDPRAEPLSDKLARSDGVLCPPTEVDRAPTPKTGNMPVIPPPGSPGGDPTIRPK